MCSTRSDRAGRHKSIKYFGIIFDYNVKWDKHIQYLIKKTKYLVFIFSKLANVMQKNTLLIRYYAFFNSIVSYGIIGWGGCLQKQHKAPL